MFDPRQIDALQAKLDAKHVKSRTQAGRALSYIEGWHAIAEANRIFGFDAWDRETVEIARLGEPREVESKWRVAFMAKVRVTVRSPDGGVIVREGCGYGSGIDRDQGAAHESALKEAETDAMKRALMTFGNPFGLALYDKEQANVDNGEPQKSDTPPAQPTTAYELIDPETGRIVERFKVAREFMDALESRMRSDDPAFWWGANQATAKLIVEQFPKARAHYTQIEQLVLGATA